MSLTTVHQRIPAALWESLQMICYKQDVKFIEDVSHILGVPAADIKKQILGTRGTTAAVITESGPWWQTVQCPLMEKVGSSSTGMWFRCGAVCEPNGTCWKHRSFTRASAKLRHYTDPFFSEIARRKPVHLDGTVYWVGTNGDVYDEKGTLKKELHIEIVGGTAILKDGVNAA